jgi:hypothetical protein
MPITPPDPLKILAALRAAEADLTTLAQTDEKNRAAYTRIAENVHNAAKALEAVTRTTS